MGVRVLQLIDYHAARAIEELDQANRSATEYSRSAHMELSRLHLYQAGWLRAASIDGEIAERID